MACAGVGRPLARHFCGGNAQLGRTRGAGQGRLRTEPADVALVVHDPIQPPLLEAPSIQDAKALADRVRDIVARAV